MRVFGSILLVAALVAGGPSVAQDDRARTLADVRQELSVLYVEIQKLKRELSTTGGPQTTAGNGSILDRVNAIESELQRLTGDTERLENRIDRVVEDGTNRISDLEFRLVELEGGDVSKLGETTTLGGDVPATTGGGSTGGTQVTGEGTSEAAGGGAAVTGGGDTGDSGVQMAVGEEDDFRRAEEALASGDFRGAADQFAAYVETYPGSPLESQAHLKRGEALEQAGDVKAAARAYLDGFSGNPGSDVAAQTLLKLGLALDKLGQRDASCQTLGQVQNRFPGAPEVGPAQEALASMGCS